MTLLLKWKERASTIDADPIDPREIEKGWKDFEHSPFHTSALQLGDKVLHRVDAVLPVLLLNLNSMTVD